MADVGRAFGGPEPVLRAVAKRVDHLGRIGDANTPQPTV